MLTANSNRMWWYWLFGIGILQQGLILAFVARYYYPMMPPLGFFSSLAMLPVLVATSIAVVLLGVIPLIEHGEGTDGLFLFGAGFLTGYTIQYHGLPPEGWMVTVIFLVFAVWGVIIGFLILCNRVIQSVLEKIAPYTGW